MASAHRFFRLSLHASVLLLLLTTSPAAALVEWSTTELQFQYGHLENPFSDANQDAFILTVQNALAHFTIYCSHWGRKLVGRGVGGGSDGTGVFTGFARAGLGGL